MTEEILIKSKVTKTGFSTFLKRQRYRSIHTKAENLTPLSSSTMDTNDDKYGFYLERVSTLNEPNPMKLSDQLTPTSKV